MPKKTPSLQHSSKHACWSFDLDFSFKVSLKANLMLAEKCNRKCSTVHEKQVYFSLRGCTYTHGKGFRTFTGNKNITKTAKEAGHHVSLRGVGALPLVSQLFLERDSVLLSRPLHTSLQCPWS